MDTAQLVMNSLHWLIKSDDTKVLKQLLSDILYRGEDTLYSNHYAALTKVLAIADELAQRDAHDRVVDTTLAVIQPLLIEAHGAHYFLFPQLQKLFDSAAVAALSAFNAGELSRGMRLADRVSVAAVLTEDVALSSPIQKIILRVMGDHAQGRNVTETLEIAAFIGRLLLAQQRLQESSRLTERTDQQLTQAVAQFFASMTIDCEVRVAVILLNKVSFPSDPQSVAEAYEKLPLTIDITVSGPDRERALAVMSAFSFDIAACGMSFSRMLAMPHNNDALRFSANAAPHTTHPYGRKRINVALLYKQGHHVERIFEFRRFMTLAEKIMMDYHPV